MGDTVLIVAFVVIVIGGIGSIRGAFLAAMLIGLVDTLGRSFAVDMLRLFMAPSPRPHGRAGHRLDADLSPDGGRAVRPARGPVSGAGTLNGRARQRRRRARACSLGRQRRPDAAVCGPRAAAGRRAAKAYLLDRFIRIMVFADRGDRARSHRRLRRADLVRPRGLHRDSAPMRSAFWPLTASTRRRSRCRSRSSPRCCSHC